MTRCQDCGIPIEALDDALADLLRADGSREEEIDLAHTHCDQCRDEHLLGAVLIDDCERFLYGGKLH